MRKGNTILRGAGIWLAATMFAMLAPMAAQADDGQTPAGAPGAVQAFDLGDDFACGLRESGKLECWGKDTQLGLFPPFTGVYAGVAAGASHACALRGDGELDCWGDSAAVGTPPAGPFTAVSAGAGDSCALRPDGRLACWGGSLAAAAPAANGHLAVSVGAGHACAIAADGALACWDASGVAPLGTPPSGHFLAVSVGAGHACALRGDGALACWGDNAAGQSAPPAAPKFVAVAVGEAHTCALDIDRTVHCWGDNAQGQATAVAGRFDRISAGRRHTCARALDGGVQCWGDNTHGQADNRFGVDVIFAGPDQACGLLQDGRVGCAGEPSALTPPSIRFNRLAFGPTAACGLTIDGTLECWGAALGIRPQGRFSEVAIGTDHACVVGENGALTCWGANDAGQATPPAGAFRELVAGDRFACALPQYGSIPVCWGTGAAVTGIPANQYFNWLSANGGNVCGRGTDSRFRCWGRDAAGIDPGSTLGQAIAVGARHLCVLRLPGDIVCFGDNSQGQTVAPAGSQYSRISAFGDTTCAQRGGEILCWGARPMRRAATGMRVRAPAIAAGAAHTCTVHDGRGVGCWGDNSFGQAAPPAHRSERLAGGDVHGCSIAGDGRVRCWGDTAQGATTPPAVAVRALDAGALNNCAIDGSGAALCWGWNVNGQGTPPAGPFRSVATGLNHSCGLREDGTLACWGYGADGQTAAPAGRYREVDVGERHSCAVSAEGRLVCWGLGTEGQTLPPTGSDYRGLAVGAFHACALRGNGSIVCWGRESSGQTTPPPGAGFVALAAGAAHNCAIADDGTRRCWGRNDLGQAPRPVVLPETLAPVVEYGNLDVTFSVGAQQYVPREPTWRIVSGGLPGGTLFRPEGRIVGQPWGIGTYHFTLEMVDRNGLIARREYTLTISAPPDTTPPRVYPSPLGPYINSGWFTGDVEMGWSVEDPESPITFTSGCESVLIDRDTDGTDFTCVALSAGGTTRVTYTLRRDTVPPDTVLLEAPSTTGNYGVAPQRFVLSVVDDHPGDNAIECSSMLGDPPSFGDCPSPHVVPLAFTYPYYIPVPGRYTQGFRARDAAGNVDPTPIVYHWDILADPSPVSIVPELSGPRGDNGWFVGDVSLRWNLSDPQTPITVTGQCDDFVWNNEGYTSRLCSARSWGGPAQVLATLMRDTVRPTLYPAPQSRPNAAGWFRAPVQVYFMCDDWASKIASCPPMFTLTDEGVAVTTGPQTARDNAGLVSEPSSFTARIDLTPPVITVAPTVPANANGWHRQNVTLRYTCSDALSGVVACPADDLVTLEGAQVAAPQRTILDVADNSASIIGRVNLDKTAPTIYATIDRQPNANGWYNVNPVVSHTCFDLVSGLASACPAPETIAGEGIGLSSTARTMFDRAGNSASSQAFTVSVDRTAPTLAFNAPPATLLLNAGHALSPTASDALSGVDSVGCVGFSTATVGTRTVTCTAVDRAGNTTSRFATYRVVYDVVPLTLPHADPNALHIVKAPRSVVTDWQVRDANGAAVVNAALSSARTVVVDCPAGGVPLTTASGGERESFRHEGSGRYRHTAWILYGGQPQCVRLEIAFNDGVVHAGILRIEPKLLRTGGPQPMLPRAQPTAPMTPVQPARPRTPPAPRSRERPEHGPRR